MNKPAIFAHLLADFYYPGMIATFPHTFDIRLNFLLKVGNFILYPFNHRYHHLYNHSLHMPLMKPTAWPQGYGGVKNVIVFIVDGMGPSYVTGLRYVKSHFNRKGMQPTAFDPYLKGMQMTYSKDEQKNITDSAASATAMATGIKTYNGAISVDLQKNRVKTVLEQAKDYGKSTGLVVTAPINHATPAAFATHNESRKNYNDIADTYFDEKMNGHHKLDVMLGGGTDYFIRTDRDLSKDFKREGYSYVTTKDELMTDNNLKLLGLFASDGLPKMIDREESVPSLADMTVSALKRLSHNPNGFFLLVEGSQVDWAGHDNDIVGAMSEMRDSEAAFEKIIEYARLDPNTLVVTCGDHSTGGLRLGRGSEYVWNPEPLHSIKRTPHFLASQIADGNDVNSTLAQAIDFELEKAELESIKEASLTRDKDQINDAIKKMLNKRTKTGWTTSGHTAEDVPVYAFGPYSHLFSGLNNNTDIAKIIFNVMT